MLAATDGGGRARRGRIDALSSLREVDLIRLAQGNGFGRSGYVERGFTRNREFYRGVVARAGFDRDDRILDLGCGFGRWSVFLAEVNRAVAGIDPMAGRLTIGRNLADMLEFDNLSFLAALGDRLPFADASFDGVWCFSTLHFADRSRTLAEVRRVLAPGGRLFVGLYFGLGRMIALLCDSFEKGGFEHDDVAFAARALEAGPEADGPPNFATRDTIEAILARSRFRIVENLALDAGGDGGLDESDRVLIGDPATIPARFRRDAGFRQALLRDYPRIVRALDFNLSFVAVPEA